MSVDTETGEVFQAQERLVPRMPPEIAAAILKVKSGVSRLGFDERNDHGKYNYASVDKFYTSVRPLESEAGLVTVLDETGFDVREGAPSSTGNRASWAFISYDVWIASVAGIMWGPLRRHWAGPITGPQTFGAAESYVRKAFMRGIYMVPTGEKDGDDTAPRDDAPATKVAASRARPAAAPASPSRDVAVAVYSRIRADIRNATSLDRLNKTGIYGPDATADYDAIRSQGEGEKAWQALVDLDAQRRLELAGFPEEAVAAK